MKDNTQRVQDLRWFHAIDFGDFASAGRFEPGKPQNITLYGTFDLLNDIDYTTGTFLDIGTCDGIVAFGAHMRGVGQAHAVDAHDNPAFYLARELLGLGHPEVPYIPNIQISGLHKHYKPKSFDVIVCAGIIYHMLFPMQAFTALRPLIKDGGFLIMETPYDPTSDLPTLNFNPMTRLLNEPFTYFLPSLSALAGMARLSGFKVHATRLLKSPERVTLLLQTASRAELLEDPDVTDFTKQMLKRDICDFEFRYLDLERLPAQASTASLKREPMPLREIDATTEKVDWPCHFNNDKPAYGTTRFETAKGNVKVL